MDGFEKYVDLPIADDFVDLATHRNDIGVSIFLPTTTASTESEGDSPNPAQHVEGDGQTLVAEQVVGEGIHRLNLRGPGSYAKSLAGIGAVRLQFASGAGDIRSIWAQC